jgi:addiction module HigA family antidote
LHPGEVVQEDFLKPLGLSINRLARELFVPPGRISAIVNGKRGITADTALRLGRFFGTTPHFWLNLQTEYDLRMVQRTAGPEIEARIRPRAG